MKKSTKFFLAGACILCGLGILLLCIGAFTGGFRQTAVMAGNGELNFGQDWLLFGRDHDDSRFDYDIDFGGEKGYTTLEGNYEESQVAQTEEISKVRIMVGGGTMQIEKAPADMYVLKAEYNNRYEYKVSDGTLYVKNVSGKTYKNKNEIIICIPEGVQLEVAEIEVGGGLLQVEEIAADSFKMSVGAGEITIDELQAKTADVEVGAGSFRIKEGVVDDIHASIAVGRIVYQGTVNGDCDVECSMGSAQLELIGDEEDFNYESSGAMGSIKIGSYGSAGIAMERNIDNDAAKDMEIECAMGSVSVSFE